MTSPTHDLATHIKSHVIRVASSIIKNDAGDENHEASARRCTYCNMVVSPRWSSSTRSASENRQDVVLARNATKKQSFDRYGATSPRDTKKVRILLKKTSAASCPTSTTISVTFSWRPMSILGYPDGRGFVDGRPDIHDMDYPTAT